MKFIKTIAIGVLSLFSIASAVQASGFAGFYQVQFVGKKSITISGTTYTDLGLSIGQDGKITALGSTLGTLPDSGSFRGYNANGTLIVQFNRNGSVFGEIRPAGGGTIKFLGARSNTVVASKLASLRFNRSSGSMSPRGSVQGLDGQWVFTDTQHYSRTVTISGNKITWGDGGSYPFTATKSGNCVFINYVETSMNWSATMAVTIILDSSGNPTSYSYVSTPTSGGEKFTGSGTISKPGQQIGQDLAPASISGKTVTVTEQGAPQVFSFTNANSVTIGTSTAPYEYVKTGPNTGRVTILFAGAGTATIDLVFTSATAGTLTDVFTPTQGTAETMTGTFSTN